MAHSSTSSNFLDGTLLPAIIISLGLHIMAAVFLSPFSAEKARLVPALQVELQQPKLAPPPPPPPPPKPEPPKPEPPKPLPKKLPPPPVRTPPPPEHQAPRPVPASELTTTPAPTTSVPQVIAAAPTTAGESTFAAPAPTESEKPKSPAPQDVDTALGNYGSLLAREFAKYKQYPRIAQMRGWQGTVKIKLEMDSSGAMISSVVSESSGFEALDKQAMEMVKKASPLPTPPEALRHKPFTITVPVVFRLE